MMQKITEQSTWGFVSVRQNCRSVDIATKQNRCKK